MTTRVITGVAACIAVLAATACHGHGLPIHVDVEGGRLVISGGLAYQNGYVDLAFDHHEDSFLDTAPGDTLGSTLPGFHINGMAVDSQLCLTVLPRPDFTAGGAPTRWLWFWDEAMAEVTEAAGNPTLELASQRLFGSVKLTQFAPPMPDDLVQVAEPRASDLGTHQHPILFLLDNSPPAPFGVYGFFARLTSPNYEPSEPFLIALNHTDPTNFATGALQINAAARLPGDFDGDDDADGADFLLWQRTVGSVSELAADASKNDIVDAADLEIWREGFGAIIEQPGSVSPGEVVAEPTGFVVGGLALVAVAVVVRSRSSP